MASPAPKRKFNVELPLRCLVRCATCGVSLTGGLCRGRSKTYPRYWCRKQGCHAVKLSKEQLETEFLAFLRRLRPNPDVLSEFPRTASKIWAGLQGDAERISAKLTARLEGKATTQAQTVRRKTARRGITAGLRKKTPNTPRKYRHWSKSCQQLVLPALGMMPLCVC